MSIYKIWMFTFIAICIAFQVVQADLLNLYSVDKYVGVWYVIGIISPEFNYHKDTKCYWIRVTKLNRFNCKFMQDVRFVSNGYANNFFVFGEVMDAKLLVAFPSHMNATTSYTIESYYNEKELILHDGIHSRSRVMISRNPFVLGRTKDEFERYALGDGLLAQYMLQEDCSYRTVSVMKRP